MLMHVLIIGKTGQVGRELSRLEWPAHVTQLEREECDLSDIASIRRAVEMNEPDIVINAAAYTAVDRAESEPELAMVVNGRAPGELARACAEKGAALIHLSTDYVFDGTKRDAYVEDDPVNPLSVYGRTKEAGEAAIRAAHDKYIILRTSWVFSAHGTNFVQTMLRLAATRPELRVVADQTGAPTSARDIALALAAIAKAVGEGGTAWGMFHFASAEPTSWHGFAEAIFAGAPSPPKIVPITTAEYPTPARRPANSILDCTRIGQAYGIAQPSWRDALAEVLVGR
jgi:dTDP-4-dehydrorhamnose reductase